MAIELNILNIYCLKVFVSNILDYLHIADVFVLTSDMEGMPNALLRGDGLQAACDTNKDRRRG